LLKHPSTEDTSMSFAKYTLVGCALSLAACVGNLEEHELLPAGEEELLEGSAAALCGPSTPTDIDVRRSLVVTEQRILQGFGFERVMSQLVRQARVPGLDATKLFQRWWDTQNDAASAAFEDVQHCEGELNGYPYDCRADGEGLQATCNPFTDEGCDYMPIGLFNRFDLAPEDGSSCGEYRIVYAKSAGVGNGRDRNLIIFEASLPNPEPRRGLRGCRDIAEFWANLSSEDDLEERAERLERFYFQGLGRGVPAVVDIRNFGDNQYGRGQVRTNQFQQVGVTNAIWTLREFKLMKECEWRRDGHWRRDQACSMDFVPVTNKGNPWGGLFADTATHPNAERFQRHFVRQVESLAASDLLGISMTTPERYNSGQSHASNRNVDTNYLGNFEDGGEFAAAIEERILDLDPASELEPVDIVARAQTQSCAGCHQLSNNSELGNGLVWPASLGFVHVSERDPETVDGVVRFRISPALTSTFLPHREVVFEQFLRGRRTHRGHSMGGRYSH
jgi:hypothetical protein